MTDLRLNTEPSLYRQHNERPHELEPTLSAHRAAMTAEALHSKAEIAEELAVRDRRIAELERRLVECAQEVEEWQDASGLCCPPEEKGGDPGGVTPQLAGEYWNQVEDERDRLLVRVAELNETLEEARGHAVAGWLQERIPSETSTATRNIEWSGTEWVAVECDCYGSDAVAIGPNITGLADTLVPDWRER